MSLIRLAVVAAVGGAFYWTFRMSKYRQQQLEQLRDAGWRGVMSHELIDQPTARSLVRQGLARNVSQINKPGLHQVFITSAGLEELGIHDTECDHEFRDCRIVANGWERYCHKCGMGTTEWALREGI